MLTRAFSSTIPPPPPVNKTKVFLRIGIMVYGVALSIYLGSEIIKNRMSSAPKSITDIDKGANGNTTSK